MEEPRVTGYRHLTHEEMDLMKEGAELSDRCKEYIEKVSHLEGVDDRCVEPSRKKIVQGFLLAQQAISHPVAL